MKKILKNIMATTGITFVVLALIATLYGAKFLLVNSVFQSFGANAVIHFGFIFTNKYASKYPILEVILDITYAVAVIIISGSIFNWYSSTPIWVLMIMVLVVYVVSYLISIFRMKEDTEEINELIRKRKDLLNLK